METKGLFLTSIVQDAQYTLGLIWLERNYLGISYIVILSQPNIGLTHLKFNLKINYPLPLVPNELLGVVWSGTSYFRINNSWISYPTMP